MTPQAQLIHDMQAVLAKVEARERDERRKKIFAWLAIVGTPLLGAAVGLWIGDAAAPQPDPNAMLDLSGIGYAFDGAAIGVLVGLVLGTIVAWAIWPRRRRQT